MADAEREVLVERYDEVDIVLAVLLEEFRPIDMALLSSLLARRRARCSRPGCFAEDAVDGTFTLLAYMYALDSSEVSRGVGARDTSMLVFDN